MVLEIEDRVALGEKAMAELSGKLQPPLDKGYHFPEMECRRRGVSEGKWDIFPKCH